MLSPQLCGCGCLQPLGRYEERIFGHWPALESGPHYNIEDRGYRTPCWVWSRATNVWGYSKIKRYRKTTSAHRFFYEAYIGPIPTDLDIDHLCRVRLCVNPEHMEAVTQIENIRRGGVAKLTEVQVAEVSQRYLAGESQYSIARVFGVGQVQISRILNGKRWKNIATVVPTRSPIKLSSEQAGEIRQRVLAGETRQAVAAFFGMSQSHVCSIVRGDSWAATT